MSFSFDATANTSQSTSKPRLEGNNIYTVKLDGAEVQDIQGVKDTSLVYKVLKIKFSNEDGTFEHTVFEPKADDFKRTETELKNKNGNMEKIPQPSNVESMMLLFKHLIDAFVPKVAEKIDKKEQSIVAKDWDSLRNIVVKIFETGKGNENKIKLVKNNKGEAKFPSFFAGLSREGITYVRNNFAGPKIAFSPYELTKIQNETTAKPNKPEDFTPEIEESSSSDVDINFDLNF